MSLLSIFFLKKFSQFPGRLQRVRMWWWPLLEGQVLFSTVLLIGFMRRRFYLTQKPCISLPMVTSWLGLSLMTLMWMWWPSPTMDNLATSNFSILSRLHFVIQNQEGGTQLSVCFQPPSGVSGLACQDLFNLSLQVTLKTVRRLSTL